MIHIHLIFCWEVFQNFLQAFYREGKKFWGEIDILVEEIFSDPLDKYYSLLRAPAATSKHYFSSIGGQKRDFYKAQRRLSYICFKN